MKFADQSVLKKGFYGIFSLSIAVLALAFGLNNALPKEQEEELVMAQLNFSVTTTPATAAYAQELTYTITVTSTIAADTHTLITVSGLIPANTTIVPNSVVNVSGRPAMIANSSIPSYTLDTLSASIPGKNTTTLRYRVRINNNANSPIQNTITVSSRLNGVVSTTSLLIETPISQNISTQGDCKCNNDNTPNVMDGTYTTRLIIRNDSVAPTGPQPLVPDLAFTVLSSTGLTIPNGTLFLYENGYYYLDVVVLNTNYSISVDGPDLNPNTDITYNGSCSGYPTIDYPAALIAGTICVSITEVVNIPIEGIFSYTYPIASNSPPTLPDGFTYSVIGGLLHLTITGSEINPQESPVGLYYFQFDTIADPNGLRTALVNASTTGNATPLFNNYLNQVCITTSLETVNFAIGNTAVINPTHFPCVRAGSPVYLSRILGEGNTSPDGFFTVIPSSGPNFIVPADTTFAAPAGGACYRVVYTIEDDECGDVASDTVNVLITTRPNEPEFTIDGQSRPAPICSTTPQVVNLSAPTANQNYFIPSGSGGSLSGNTLSLPAPALVNEGEPVSARYTICMAATGGVLPTCPAPPGGWNIAPAICTDTLCKTIVMYNDGYNCGADALFTPTCPEPFKPDLCFADATPGLELGCRWFSITSPDIMTAEVVFDEDVIDCTTDSICGTYSVTFFGLDLGNSESSATISSFPGIGTICRVLNFKIFGFRPLGALADLLGCNKTIAQFILDLLGTLVGGDGGEVLVRADTDGDGAFDFTAAEDGFPSTGTLCVPNRVAGTGYISARAIGTWPSGIPDECGALQAGEISLMELLPIGAIPIVGPTIEDILESAGCDVILEFSAYSDSEVLVTSSSPATFANCDTTAIILYTYTAQNTTCVFPAGLWNIPTAFTSCDNVILTYKGVSALEDITEEGVYQTAGPAIGSLLIPGDTMVTFTAVGCNGNYSSCSIPLSIIEADPSFEAGFICCSEQSVFLGGAGWDGIGAPPIANTIRLDAIRGRYPVTMGGQWTGQGVEFYNPDGLPFNGDEYYLFNPMGLDGGYTLTYTLAGQPCDISFSRDIEVTCQNLQVSLTDQETCPGNWVPERIIIIDLSDDSITVTSSGLSNIGAAGGHYGGGPILDPVVELIDTIANEGRVVVPGFFAPAIRDTTFTVCIRVYQRNSPYGCEDLFCYDIRVVDTIAPVFINCPTEPIVVDALLGQCEAFVNFPFPIAFDSCLGNAVVTQVDETGLKSGDLFPVGLTVLSYSSIDTVGNQNYCEIKIIVQDFRLAPRIECRDNVEVTPNDPDDCGAVVDNIAPVEITDNCPSHVAITYEVTGPDGEQVACGFEDASGTNFPIGTSTVKYKVQDQPLILITEVQQRDGFYGVEITNFGPSAVDITCGQFILKDENGIVLESFTVPTDNNISTMFQRPIYPPVIPVIWNVRTPNNILDVGETFTHIFDGDQNGDGILDVTNTYDRCQMRSYCFGFLDHVFDEIAINEDLDAEVILRNTVCDNDLITDFRAAHPCDTASFGVLNPGLPTMTFANDTVGLQLLAPSMDMCSFTVTIEDTEAPTCIWRDTVSMVGTNGLVLQANLCLQDTVSMPAGTVFDVNILNLNMSTANAGAIGAYLRGPTGVRIKLFDRICSTDSLFCSDPAGISGSADILITLDKTVNKWDAAPSVTFAPCAPMGQGGTFSPEESFDEFYGTDGGGDWILEIYGEEGTIGTLNSWELQVHYQIPFGQMDTVMFKTPTLCETQLTWVHPILEDNCIKGEMVVDYLFSNEVTNETDSSRVVIANATNTINMMGCAETRIFEVGTTIVRYTLTDQYGNLSQCSFTVTVLDNEIPVFVPGTCYDRQIFLGPGECTGSLINPPTSTDNCSVDEIIYCFVNAAGMDSVKADISQLPIGDYILVAKAVDIYGNIQRCEFRVVVIEFVPTTRNLACFNDINLPLDGDCIVEVTTSMLLADGSNVRCYDNYCIEVLDELGKPRSPVFTKVDEGKSFKVVITDCTLPSVPPYNSCWGYVHIERKLGPEMTCPQDTIVYCNVDANAKDSNGKYILGEPEVTSCETTKTIWHQDEWTSYGDCDTIRALLTRTWYLENEKSQRTSCVQEIRFRRMQVDSIVFPPDYVELICSDVENNPDLLLPEVTGYPSMHGFKINRIGGLCQVSLLYTDEKYEICYGSYEILRTWKVRDMCAPVSENNPRQSVQVIKVTQKSGPRINDCPEDITVSVDAWECLYSGDLPLPNDIDPSCAHDYSFNARIYGGGRIYAGMDNKTGKIYARVTNLRKGVYRVVYEFKDLCLNKSQCVFNITVVDEIAPVTTAKEYITVSLTRNDDNSGETGIAKVYAHQIDNGSYDNCGEVRLEIRREGGAPSCLNGGDLYDDDGQASTPGVAWNNNVTYNNDGHESDSPYDTDNGEYVKFCCEDIGQEIKAWLRVWDDASGDGIFGNEGDLYNETWSIIKVEDKTVPKIYCQDDIVINCDRDTGSITRYNFQNASGPYESVIGKVPAAIWPTIEGVCNGFELEFRDAGALNTCNTGTFTRTYRIVGFPLVQCTQLITVRGIEEMSRLEHPISLHVWNKCTLTEEDVLLNTVRLDPGLKPDADGGCPTYNLNKPATNSSMTEAQRNAATTNGFTPTTGPLEESLRNQARFNPAYKNVGCTVYGKKLNIEEYTVGEGCKKWLVRWEYINWCTNSDAGCRTTVYKFEDTTPPLIVTCAGADADIVDGNCVAAITLSPEATDTGGCDTALTWKVSIYTGSGAAIPNNATPVREISNVKGAKPVFTFNGTGLRAPLEAGLYTAHYKVTDGCGNVSECEAEIGVWPKAPTPYCVSISSAVMKSGVVELWARDFDRGSGTNCGNGVMLFTFNNDGEATHPSPAHIMEQHYFRGVGEFLPDNAATLAMYNAGEIQKWNPEVSGSPGNIVLVAGTSGKMFGCKVGDDISAPIDIEMRVWDFRSFKAGTTQGSDFCITKLSLIDNQEACGPGSLIVLGGNVETSFARPMKSVDLELSSELPEYPVKTTTDAGGIYFFNGQPKGVAYTIKPVKNDNVMDGINTLDLVHIQRHILALKKFDVPHKLIAADVDFDQAVRVNDLIILRKMILGVYASLPSNKSWSFFNAGDILGTIPWPFNEQVSHAALTESSVDNNFTGVKLGDVDGSNSLNSLAGQLSKRSQPLTIAYKDIDVEVGQEFEVSLSAHHFEQVYGMQFSLKHQGLKVVEVAGRALDIDENNFAVHADRAQLNLSWSSETFRTFASYESLINIRFISAVKGKLSDLLSLSDEVTRSEAYINDDFETVDIELTQRSEEPLEFVLYQNEPNPWKDGTRIDFDLPGEGYVQFGVYDITGRKLFDKLIPGMKGRNTIGLLRSELQGQSGILFYKFEFDGKILQKKMLIIE